ncbi:hypothetical protein ABEH08_20405 [Pantoea agglomerans]|uniref:hypothetical protein n=1 Tax=Enterobacter agglomerans TaxID=549 RepID=UPI00165494C8|nr:hypothetical protein [Pantoea agglomerans]
MNFKKLILKIFNFSFIFHASCDKNFDTYRAGLPVRISLIHLNVGISHLYIATYCRSAKNFLIWHQLKFKDVAQPVDPKVIDDKVNAFSLSLSGKSDIHDAQVDVLKEKKADNKDAISGAYNKASFFLAFITSVVGLLAFLLPTISEYHSQSFFKIAILWFLVLSSLMNVLSAGFFIFQILNVKGYLRRDFKELSSSNGDNFELLYHYFEWKSGEAERVNIISLLRNAIKYSMAAFCFAILLWSFLQVFPTEKIIDQKVLSIPVYYFVENSTSLTFEGIVKNETVLI